MAAAHPPVAVAPPSAAAALTPNGRRLNWLAMAVLVLAGFGVYSRSLDAPFVFDDGPAIVMNESIRDLSRLERVLAPPPDGPAVSARPVINLSFALNYAIGGLNPRGYHLTNVAIHVLAALTLFGLLRRTLALPAIPARLRASAQPAAFVIALLWTVHPLQTETVICVVQRTESFVSLFYLLTFYGFLRAAHTKCHPIVDTTGGAALTPSNPIGYPTRGPGAGVAGRRWLALAWGACLLGMATKEVMVTAPVMILLFDRIFLAGSWREAWHVRGRWHLGFAATWLLLALLLLQTGGQRGTAAGFGLGVSSWTYLLTQARAIAIYLKLCFWPHPLIVDYGVWMAGGFGEVAPEFFLVATLVAATAVALWRWPRVGFLGAWFFALLAPSSSVIPLISQTIAEHRMYLPLASVLVLVVLAGFAWRRRVALPAGLVLAAAAAYISVVRSLDYRSAEALWGDTAKHVPSNGWARFHFGNALMERRDFAGAESAFRDALRIAPANYFARVALGTALNQQNRPNEAAPELQAAIRQRPDYPKGHYQLGQSWLALGRPGDAVGCFAEAVRMSPDDGDAEGNWGVALFQLGRAAEAVPHLERAAKLLPLYPDAHFNLGLALAQVGRSEDARRSFREALRLDPEFTAAREMLEQLAAGSR